MNQEHLLPMRHANRIGTADRMRADIERKRKNNNNTMNNRRHARLNRELNRQALNKLVDTHSSYSSRLIHGHTDDIEEVLYDRRMDQIQKVIENLV
jgi:hypothetical protein